MDNSDLQSLGHEFAAAISKIPDRNTLSDKGNAFLAKMPEAQQMEVAAILHEANPFFVPAFNTKNVANIDISADHLAQFQMLATVVAHNANQANILVACAPKSASSFIASALARAGHLTYASLIHNLSNVGLGASFGINNREQEIDHLALIRHGLNGRGYVAQHHARCTPYLCNLLTTFNVLPVVTYRNIMDCIVSLDDMVMKDRKNSAHPDGIYFFDSMPRVYHQMEREERLYLLAGKMAYWYINFYVSWKHCETLGLVSPLWISYEDDFLGDRKQLAQRMATFIGTDHFDPALLTATLQDDASGSEFRLNVGKAGRGRDIPQNTRDTIMRIAEPYRHEGFDLTPLLGTP